MHLSPCPLHVPLSPANQLIAIALIYHIGIIGEDVSKISECAEMQNNVVKRVVLNKEEENLIDTLIELEFEEFCSILNDIEEQKVKEYLSEIACISSIISKDHNDEKLLNVLNTLDIKDHQKLINKFKTKLL